MATSSLAQQAEALAASGDLQKAIGLLGSAATRNDPEAFFTLANWSLAGVFVKRDLPLSRDFFRRAADLGHQQAAAIYRAFVANGTGSPPDWQKSLTLLQEAAPYDQDAQRQLRLVERMKLTAGGDPLDVSEGRRLSDEPEVTLFPKLLLLEECAFLSDAALPLLQPSVVVDPATGQQTANPIRTSSGAAFPLALENPAIHALNRRLAAASRTDVRQGEPLQILRYEPGQEYRTHSDALPRSDNQRILTFLVYLNDDYEGGETFFPKIGLRVRGSAGDGLLFRNAAEDGRPDPLALHAGLPVSKGAKLIASRWIRARPLALT